MSLYLEQGEVEPDAAARAVREGAARRPPRPGVLRVGAHGRRRGRAAARSSTSSCPIRPKATRRCFTKGEGDGGHRVPLGARSGQARARARVQGRHGPVRRQARHLPRAPGHGHARHAALRRRRPQAVQGRPPVHAAGRQERRDRPRGAGRHRRGREGGRRSSSTACCTTRTTRTRSTWQPLEFPTPMHGVAIEPKRRGDEGRISDVLHRMIAEDPTLKRRARHQSQRDGAVGPGRPAPALGARAHGEPVQARGDDAPAAHSLSRDDHRGRRRPSPAQEADGRRGPVRRGLPQDRAAAARHRLRVREHGEGRRDPDVADSRGAEGRRAGAAPRVRSRAFRCRTCASTCTTASTIRSTRRKSRSSRPAARRSSTRSRRRGRSCSSRSSASRSTVPPRTWAT